MQRKLACPELCIQILQIIPVGEVGAPCKGPACTPHPHSHGKGEGTVERGLLGCVRLDKGCREGHSVVLLAYFSSQHLPFQEAESQVTAVPKGAGTVGCHGATGGARGVLTG